jgi:hypothetical protein
LIQFSIPRWRPLRSSKAGKREARGKHDAGMETACGWSESCMPNCPCCLQELSPTLPFSPRTNSSDHLRWFSIYIAGHRACRSKAQDLRNIYS